jgi:hypothetical protein
MRLHCCVGCVLGEKLNIAGWLKVFYALFALRGLL